MMEKITMNLSEVSEDLGKTQCTKYMRCTMLMYYVFNALKLVPFVREQLNRIMLINTCSTLAKFKLQELLNLQLNIYLNYSPANEPSPGAWALL